MKDRIGRARIYLSGEGLGPFLVRAAAGTGAVRIGAMLASFLVGVQLARGLGVAGYGYYGIALSVISIAGIPGEMGLPPLVTREVAAADARGDPSYLFAVVRWAKRIALRLSVAMAVAVIVGALVLDQIRPSPLALALAAGAPTIPFMALTRVNGGAQQGLKQIVRGQLPAFLLKPLAMSALLFLIFLLGLKLKPWSAMALYSLTAAAAWAIAMVWLRQSLPQQGQVKDVRDGRRWLSSMIPMGLTQGMLALQGQMSVLLLGFMMSAADVGLFRISTATAVMISAPQAIMVAVAPPMISRLHEQQDRRRLQTLLTRSAQAQFAGVLFLSLPLFIAPREILSLVYGADYAAAADVLRIILVGQLISAGFGLNGSVLNMTHHERRVTRAMALALLLNILSFALLVPIWGLRGAAAGYVMSMLAWNIGMWIDARRLVGVDTSFVPVSRASTAP
jgi:O-antigen/teichoic acid export membrane protein